MAKFEQYLKVAQAVLGSLAAAALAADAAVEEFAFPGWALVVLGMLAGWAAKRPSDLAHKPAPEA